MRFAWWGVAVFPLVAIACPNSPPTGSGGTTGTIPSPASLKDLGHNDLPPDTLGCAALTASEQVLQAVAGHPLDDATLQALPPAAFPAKTQELLAYVVSCALDPGEVVGATLTSLPAASPGGPPWQGQLGLCGAASGSPWHLGAPTPACLALVSSCVFARVNILDERVVISIRGEPSNLFPLRDVVPVETEYREMGGTPIPSLAACTGPTGDCGWSALAVGRCVAGTTITVQPSGTFTGVPELRACAGLYGCELHPTQTRQYSWHLADGTTSVAFKCPNNGPSMTSVPDSVMRYGYYSILSKTPGELVGASAGDYPAKELEVFTYREGGFYGDLFSKKPCNSSFSLPPEEFACYSDVWSYEDAELTARLCAGNAAMCFPNAPTPCQGSQAPSCAAGDGAQGDYHGCTSWPGLITTYLNHPCDLVPAKACSLQAGGSINGGVDTKPFPYVPPQGP